MAGLLDDDDAFVRSFDEPRRRALRRNPAKVGPDELAELLDVDLDPVPWSASGNLLPPETALGGHPAHLSGLFYLQEPSAMAVAEAAGIEPGSTVIDLAAAPGGKTTHLAALVGPTGLVVANEVAGERLRALHDNLDLWGAMNVVTISRPLDRLAPIGPSFDGRGPRRTVHRRGALPARSRRHPAVVAVGRRWRGPSSARPSVIGRRSRQARGRSGLQHLQLRARGERRAGGHASRRPRRLDDRGARGPARCRSGFRRGGGRHRAVGPVLPHRRVGEGQFIARLRRSDRPSEPVADRGRPARSDRRRSGSRPRRRSGRSGSASTAAPPTPAEVVAAWAEFQRIVLPDFDLVDDRLVVDGDRLFASARPTGLIGNDLGGLSPARPGLPLGRVRPGRFEPHAGLATAVVTDTAIAPDRVVSWGDDDPRLHAYLRGETVEDAGPDGWVLVRYRRWGLGWARRSRGVLKNTFPRHLRRQAAAHLRRLG